MKEKIKMKLQKKLPCGTGKRIFIDSLYYEIYYYNFTYTWRHIFSGSR